MSNETQEKSAEQNTTTTTTEQKTTEEKSKEKKPKEKKPKQQNKKQNQDGKKNESKKEKPKKAQKPPSQPKLKHKIPPKNKLQNFVFRHVKPARNLGSGGVLPKTKALGRLVRWPKYVKLQRQKKNIASAFKDTTSNKHLF